MFIVNAFKKKFVHCLPVLECAYDYILLIILN